MIMVSSKVVVPQIDEQIEAQKGQVTCLSQASWEGMQELEFQ